MRRRIKKEIINNISDIKNKDFIKITTKIKLNYDFTFSFSFFVLIFFKL